MDRLIYTALSGMADSMNRQRTIANNMANAQTTGFRAEMIYATPVTLKTTGPTQSLEVRSLADGEVRGFDMRAGAVSQTARPMDVALQGNALLAVQGADGDESYTRRGDLSISPEGILQNGDGLPVIGGSGPISLPLDAKISIASDGTILAANPETPDAPPQVVDRLKLVSPTGSRIAKDLNGQFIVVGGGVLPSDESAKLIPSALEQSNVNASEVMVQMIEAQRLFDIRTKVIATARDIDERGTSLMRMS